MFPRMLREWLIMCRSLRYGTLIFREFRHTNEGIVISIIDCFSFPVSFRFLGNTGYRAKVPATSRDATRPSKKPALPKSKGIQS